MPTRRPRPGIPALFGALPHRGLEIGVRTRGGEMPFQKVGSTSSNNINNLKMNYPGLQPILDFFKVNCDSQGLLTDKVPGSGAVSNPTFQNAVKSLKFNNPNPPPTILEL